MKKQSRSDWLIERVDQRVAERYKAEVQGLRKAVEGRAEPMVAQGLKSHLGELFRQAIGLSEEESQAIGRLLGVVGEQGALLERVAWCRTLIAEGMVGVLSSFLRAAVIGVVEGERQGDNEIVYHVAQHLQDAVRTRPGIPNRAEVIAREDMVMPDAGGMFLPQDKF